ncbi:MAG: phage gp6-like head-tail connector protein [Proteobacteria bacterium]|nr:phage gp6-like head-tail connector protein [Pseudomonadota bacterium]
MAVTVQDLRARVETDLDDDTLQRILDSAVQAIDRAAGKAIAEQEAKLAANSEWFATIRRPASGIVIKERRRHTSPEVTLAADDYRQVGTYRFLRLTDGTNPAPCWGHEVVIDYVPEVDEDVRDRVALDISQVDLEFRAFEREKSGDWEGEQKEWKSRRRELLAQVREGRSLIQ